MCFVLYAGTSHPIPRREWRKDAPDLSVKSLTERESPIAAHFSKPQIQYIGSTSDYGCDFPYLVFQSGEWGAGLDGLASGVTTKPAAPRFVMFEAWALRLPGSGDFPDPQLGSVRLVYQDRAGADNNWW